MALRDLQAHRIGLLALRAPRVTWALIALVVTLAVIGLSQLTIDTSLTKLFHGETEEYRKFERLLKVLPASEHDVLVLVRGDRITTPERLEAIRGLHLELRLVDTVRSVVSIFSARSSSPATAEAAPVLPEEISADSDLPALERRLLDHPLVAGRLLSQPSSAGQVALLVVSLDPARGLGPARDQALRAIAAIAEDVLPPAGLTWLAGGVPMARAEMIEGIKHDFVFFNSAGFIVGISICGLFFRRWRFVLIAGLCPLTAAFLSSGLMGLAGVKLSPLMTAIPLLVMAVTFTDAMHILFAIRENARNGMAIAAAVTAALRDVGPACIIASATTAAALFSLTLANAPLVVSFGLWAGLSSLVGVLSLMVLLPALALLLLASPGSAGLVKAHRREERIAAFCGWLAARIAAHSRAIVVGAALLTIVLATLYANLAPRYRLSDQLPRGGGFRLVNQILDKQLAGANQIFVLLEARAPETTSLTRLITVVRQLHGGLEALPGTPRVLSLVTLLADPAASGELDDAALAERLAGLPANLLARLLDQKARSAIVALQVADLEAAEIAKFADRVDTAAARIAGRYSDVRLTVTGMPVLLARETPKIVREINHALIAAFGIVFLLVGLAFNSGRIALLSVIPNLLPVFAAGAIVYLSYGGLEYASVVGLTVAFGLAVDDSAHFLNRLMLLSGRTATTAEAVQRSIATVGPVLIVTTVILMCAMAISVFSAMPPTQIFGQTCVATLIAALIADLIILPALVLTFPARDA